MIDTERPQPALDDCCDARDGEALGGGALDDAVGALLTPIVVPGENVWRIARADRASVIVDAAHYYHVVRQAMSLAQRRILIIGWDFDSRIVLEPTAPPHRRETLGQYFLRLARENPSREIAILKWSFGALKQFLRPSALIMLLRWRAKRAIRYQFDSAHPAGCSHHQKIVVIDSALAVCGGIDISSARWDTRDHADDHPNRRLPNGKPYAPWHDVTMLMTGAIAGALEQLGERRWQVASRTPLQKIIAGVPPWPDDLFCHFTDVDVAIARTRAAYAGAAELREVEALYLDMIAAATRFIYFENQYFTSGKIAAAIAARMAEADPPEVVLVMPRAADGWLEQKAMDAARFALAAEVGKVDRLNRFRIYVPVTAGGADIYVHAKLAIVDDRLLRIGSSNMNNRSLGLDSECDVIIDAALPANRGVEAQIAGLKCDLIAEHIGASPTAVAAELAASGSLIGAITALSAASQASGARRLELLELTAPSAVDRFIAENELLDPEHAAGFFEPLGKRGLSRRWRQGLRWRPRWARRWKERRIARRAGVEMDDGIEAGE